jgi:hypothetical protein
VHRPDRSISIRSVDGVENLAEVEKEVEAVVPGASISPRFSEFVPLSSSVGGLIHDDDDDDDDVYLNKLQTKGVKKSILYM